MSSMDAAKALAASGTRRARSVRRRPFPKAPRSGGIPQKARGHGVGATAHPVSGACHVGGRDTVMLSRTKPNADMAYM